MQENQFNWDDVTFSWEKEDGRWLCHIKRSTINTQDLKELERLNLPQVSFLPQTVAVGESDVTFTYLTEAYGLSLETVRSLPLVERLRLALNSLDLAEAANYPINLLLHPENLFITKNGTFQIAYRALPEVMAPYRQTKADLFRQLKCLVITLLSKEDFASLYDGSLEVADLSDFLGEIRQTESLDDLRQILEGAYAEKKQEEDQRFQRVSSLQYKIYKQATIWLGALSVLLAVPLIYLIFSRQPFQSKLLDADEAFIKQDYSEVISELEGVSSDQLPNTQKYELAYSYIQGLSLTEEQETAVLNNVTLKSEDLYLDYWIAIGRGEASEATDIAKRLDDVDLTLYALVSEMEQVRQSEDLSGEEREEKLKALQSDYDTYLEERTSLLSPDETTTSEVTRHD